MPIKKLTILNKIQQKENKNILFYRKKTTSSSSLVVILRRNDVGALKLIFVPHRVTICSQLISKNLQNFQLKLIKNQIEIKKSKEIEIAKSKFIVKIQIAVEISKLHSENSEIRMWLLQPINFDHNHNKASTTI